MPMLVERVARACDASWGVNVRERQLLGQLAGTAGPDVLFRAYGKISRRDKSIRGTLP
jgi:hypothetical protein